MKHYFVVRVELNNHDEGDYEQLHKVMEGILFNRVVQAIDNNWYSLPTGEYVRFSDNTLDDIAKLIDVALKAFIAKKPTNRYGKQKDYEYLLSKSEQLRFKLKRH